MILAGDIGGTKTNLAYFTEANGVLTQQFARSYSSKQHASLSAIIRQFIQESPQMIDEASPKAGEAAFGIAGPVVNGRCEATNLPWVVDARSIASEFGVKTVGLLNDLEATAYGTLRLQEKDKLQLNVGVEQQHGAIGVIAAGTGLGEGGLVWNGASYQTLPSEGGHSDFAPRNELEMSLLRFLLTKYKRVSNERVVSGMGIVNIYQFFRTQVNYAEPQWLAHEMAGDAAAAISNAALAGKDEACIKTMELFVSLYGAEAGNLALKLLSTSGMYIGGGIAPKILALLQQANFMDSFTNKGRLSGLVKNIPVYVVLNDKTALLGAAHYALTQP
jgi:glucokinase